MPVKTQRRRGQFRTRKSSSDNRKRPRSVQANSVAGLSKADLRYWHGVVFHSTYTRNGHRQTVSDWSVKIQHEERRETFGLGTPNRAAAAAFAREIYLFLRANGWSQTAAKFKRSRRWGTAAEIVTVGDFLQVVRAHFGGKQKTIDDYSRAFRYIVAGIFGIDADSS